MSTVPASEAAIGKLEPFLSKVRTAAADLSKKLDMKEQRVWYRGLSRSDYKLLPSLLRKGLVGDNLRQKEKNLFARFQVQAGELLPHELRSSWEILSVMQHYRVPTRMMDWTDSLFVALYFALEYEDEDKNKDKKTEGEASPALLPEPSKTAIDPAEKKDKPRSPPPCIWLLHPFALNKRALKLEKGIIFDQVDRLPENAYKIFIGEKDAIEEKDASKLGAWPPKPPFQPELPVATAPIWGHPRAVRQHGFFTIHGTDPKPLEEQAKDLVVKIEIEDEGLRGSLRTLLEEAGLDHYSVFPDLEGLARKLRRWYHWT